MLRPTNPIQVFSPYFFDIAGVRKKSSDPGALYRMVKEIDPSVVPYEQWYDIMIHRMCLEFPKGTCSGDVDGDSYTRPLRWQDLISFVNAVIAVVRTGFGGKPIYTNQQEADRRTSICNECPKNKHVVCAGCIGLIKLADLFIKQRYAKGQSNLGACVACGCWLPAKIWLSEPALQEVMKREKDVIYASHCWVKEI